MSNMLLEDYENNFQYQLLEAGDTSNGKFFIRGVVSKAGEINKNRRFYSLDVMNECVTALQSDIAANRFVGELDHPTQQKVNVNKISHKITKLSMAPDGAVISEMYVIDTPEGKILKTLIKEGIGLGVSTRAIGSTKPAPHLGESVVEVLKGLKMKAIDVVFDPSAGDYGRPEFVMESTTDGGITIMRKASLRAIYEEMFGKL